MSRNTPPKPITKPRMDSHVGFVPFARRDSNKTSQNGDVEIINAAMPEGTVLSARATSPLPPSSKRVPTMAVDFQFPRVGISSPAARRQMTRIAPEIRKRNDACMNGGMVSTANRIARYVEPHTMYSASNAIQSLVFIRFLLFSTMVGRVAEGISRPTN